MTPKEIDNYRWWAGGMNEADGRIAMELLDEIEVLQASLKSAIIDGAQYFKFIVEAGMYDQFTEWELR